MRIKELILHTRGKDKSYVTNLGIDNPIPI